MARIRSIKPTAFTSRSLAAVSIPARWMFAGIWTYADDEGRGDAEPRLIKAAVFPLDDEVTAEIVSGMLDELAAEGMIRLYKVSGRSYFQVVHWWHQKVSHPSPSGIPPEPSGTAPESGRNGIEKSSMPRKLGAAGPAPHIPENLQSPPETFRPDRDLDRDLDRDREVSQASPTKRAARLPEDWAPSSSSVEWQRKEKIPNDMARRELTKFRNYWLAEGGQRAAKLNWDRAWQNWLIKAGEQSSNGHGKPAPNLAIPEAWR